jgi:HEAT repeat protein
MLRSELSATRRREGSVASAPATAPWFIRQILGLLGDSRAEVRADAARVLRALLARDGSALLDDGTESPTFVPAVGAAVELAGGGRLVRNPDIHQETRVLAFAEMLEAGLRPLAAGLQASQGEGEEALAPLEEALRDRSLHVRRSVCDVLAGVGGEQSIEMLSALLRDPSPDLRAQAAEALGRLEAVSASSGLVGLLGDPVAEVRAAAAAALAEIHAEDACGQIVEALKHECSREDATPRARIAMVRSVVSLADGGGTEIAGAFADLPRPIASRLAAWLESEGVIERWLTKEEWGGNEDVLSSLLGGAAELGVTRSLLDALQSTEDSVRLRCAAALSRSHSPAAIPSLATLLDDPSPAVRAEGVGAIARLGGAAALESLCRAAADPDLTVRLAAARGFQDVLASRMTWIPEELPADFDLEAAISESRRTLLAVVRDPDPIARAEAGEALAFLDSPEVAETLSDLALGDPDPTVRERSADALAQCGPSQSRRFLAAALEEQDESRRERAMVVLGRLGGGEAGRHLAEALKDESPRVRQAALAALPRVDLTGMADQLLAHLRHPDAQVRAGVAAELGRCGASECVEPLVQALSDPEEEVRINAVRSLTAFGRAVRRHEDALSARQSDPSARVRKAASAALSALREVWAEAVDAAELSRRGHLSAAAASEVADAAASGDLDPLLQALDDRRSARRIAACLADSDRAKLAPILALLRRARATDRGRAATALSQALRAGVPADGYIEELRSLDSDVRLMALDIIGRLGTPDAVRALLEVLERDPLSEVRSRAASGLAESPSDTVRAALRHAQQQDPDRIVRSAAGRALEQIREATAPPTVLSGSEDSTTDLDGAQATG